MKRILLTGGSGFVGSNILRAIKDMYDIDAPTRSELDIRDENKLKEFVLKGKYDIIIHTASPSPVRSADKDSYENLMHDMLQIYMNIYKIQHLCEKIIYCGSGAEYNKDYDICNISEEAIGKNIPKDNYGLGKYIMNELARKSSNIYNLRIFACFGPNEYASKFITYAIRSCLENRDIVIRQDCYFDYLYIEDYIKFLIYFIDHKPEYHDYNICSGQRVLLSEIAKKVLEFTGSKKNIFITATEFNKEYTGSNERALLETGLAGQISNLDDGIKKLIQWEKLKCKEE